MTRTMTVAVLVSASFLFAAPVRADDFFALANPTLVKKEAPPNPDRGAQIGLRSGYALPFGKPYDGDADVRGDVKGAIPIWIDAGYRFSPALYVGAYGLFGFGLVNTSNNACALDGVSCSAYDVRVGVNAQLHFRAKASVDPWVGLGFGYEWMHQSASGPGGSKSQTLRGFELIGLQVGTDFEADKGFKVGPFIGYSFGKFSSGSVSQKDAFVNASRTLGIANTALHEWLVLGLRGTFNL
jgi:hypothetical protein